MTITNRHNNLLVIMSGDSDEAVNDTGDDISETLSHKLKLGSRLWTATPCFFISTLWTHCTCMYIIYIV